MTRNSFEDSVGKLLKKNKIKYEYETKKISYTITANYIPDFIVGDIYLETKGYFKPADRRKMLAVKKSNPDLDIRLWFMRDNYLTKSKKGTYTSWATRHGFHYHVGTTFPKKWFKKS